jgi:aspartyl-tRNA(Asn)/glutamyl-tRNA(Gln) amidotransferase subunit B
MARIPASTLRRYLFGGQISTTRCLRRQQVPAQCCAHPRRTLATATETIDPTIIPLRKQLKDQAKARKSSPKSNKQSLKDWELTVGIEIHAQLNTARKLFSSAASTINDAPNTHVAFFDLALPGSQPQFQKETLIPALRAALALDCKIQTTSQWDRKHYFHWDQPAGYQITQYYQPFAKDGSITLFKHDGIAEEDGEEITVGIKQVQMEQDTAKTMSRVEGEHLLDFNRVGLPLVEIITLPQIHHPQTAAALVRKVQKLLNVVDACVLGMESGGLRADVNVSVRRRDTKGTNAYAGVKGLGQRTEIKNLSSFKAVEDAIIAERDRQISVVESGGSIEGETRGWTLGSTETRRLRGKEGEVDYRYMPDPDLAPLRIDATLIRHLSETMPDLPDDYANILTREYGITHKDAMALISLNDGGRAEYFRNVADALHLYNQASEHPDAMKGSEYYGRLACNWVLHEMGGLVSDSSEEENVLEITEEGDCVVPDVVLATMLRYLDQGEITGKTAKKVLRTLFEDRKAGGGKAVHDIIEEQGLWFNPFSEEEYRVMAKGIVDEHPEIVKDVLVGDKKGKGKLMLLVGQMMRADREGRMDPKVAAMVLEEAIGVPPAE